MKLTHSPLNRTWIFLCFPIFIVLFTLLHCGNIEDFANEKRKARGLAAKEVSPEEIEKWKTRLSVEEAELKELDNKIKTLVAGTGEAAALSWRIGQGYMKISNYESAVHHYDSAILYMEKALGNGRVNKEMLFEAGLAYANASKDRGWDRERRQKAIDLFEQLVRLDPEDSRFPYQLALIYFDSSISEGAWDGTIRPTYNDLGKSFELLDAILRKEPQNIPVRFARANFLFRMGKIESSETEYLNIKTKIESMKEQGMIREDLKELPSYQNALKNLKEIQKLKNNP